MYCTSAVYARLLLLGALLKACCNRSAALQELVLAAHSRLLTQLLYTAVHVCIASSIVAIQPTPCRAAVAALCTPARGYRFKPHHAPQLTDCTGCQHCPAAGRSRLSVHSRSRHRSLLPEPRICDDCGSGRASVNKLLISLR